LGHQVTVLTGFPNYPTGIRPAEYRGKWLIKERHDQLAIIRVPHYVAPNKGFFKRILIHITFAVSASIYSLFMKRDDIIYLESPPLFNGFIGLVSKWFRRIPYFFNVADLWPQTAIELGALRNKQVIAVTQWLERTFYNQAARILAVTAGIQSFIVRMGYKTEKVALITNGVDHLVFADDVEPDTSILGYRHPGRILAIYAGTHGMAHALGTILDAAERLRNEPIDFLFIGDGPEKKMLIEKTETLGLNNVAFLDPLPQAKMPGVMRAADVAIINLRNVPLFDSAMPSKCFEAMAAGLPIMLAVRGEMAGHIEKAQCGICAEPENLDQIVEAFRLFIAIGDSERREMGKRGRAYAVEHFSRDMIARKLESLMRETVIDGQ
jgi:glycosyltransferase involved in cell wall biosynthesis